MRRVAAACVAIPVAVLAACYAWLAADHGTLRLWSVVVHESGRYTLGQTVLYFGHFLREVPTDVAYALFLLGAGAGVGRSPRVAAESRAAPVRGDHRALVHHAARARRAGWIALAAAAALVAIALLATAGADGLRSALLDLAQFRTRDDVTAYGSHWRFHWLSTLWFGAAVGLAPWLAARIGLEGALQRSASWERAAWAFFVAATAVFGVSADVFTDTRYLGHQAREILTHGPVTALLGLGVLLAARQWSGVEPHPAGAFGRVRLRVLAATAIPAYLAVTALRGDVMAVGQSDRGLAAMVAAHYFEHTLDYLLVALLVIGALALRAARSAGPPGARTADEESSVRR